jgi:hypothetical protein
MRNRIKNEYLDAVKDLKIFPDKFELKKTVSMMAVKRKNPYPALD